MVCGTSTKWLINIISPLRSPNFSTKFQKIIVSPSSSDFSIISMRSGTTLIIIGSTSSCNWSDICWRKLFGSTEPRPSNCWRRQYLQIFLFVTFSWCRFRASLSCGRIILLTNHGFSEEFLILKTYPQWVPPSKSLTRTLSITSPCISVREV